MIVTFLWPESAEGNSWFGNHVIVVYPFRDVAAEVIDTLGVGFKGSNRR